MELGSGHRAYERASEVPDLNLEVGGRNDHGS